MDDYKKIRKRIEEIKDFDFIDQTIATRESGNEAIKQLAKRIVKRGEADDLSAIFVRKS